MEIEQGPGSPWVTYLLLGRIGDALMATALMDALARRYPLARFRLVASAACAGLDDEMLQGMVTPGASRHLKRWHHPRGNLQALLALRRRSQAVVDLNPAPSKSAAALMALSRADAKVGFRKGGLLGQAYTRTIAPPREDEPMLERYRRLAAFLGASPAGVRGPRVLIGAAAAAWADRALGELGAPPGRAFIIIHPGNFKKFDNRWPEEKFVALADRLSARADLRLCWLAGPGERGKVEAIARACRTPAPLLPAATLQQTGALLRRARLFICNITGTTHLAHAVGARTFGLYSRYTDAVWRLKGEPCCGGIVSSEWNSCRSIGVEQAERGISAVLAFPKDRNAGS
ncbi:MAG: glycosyltransferase family 9 protein [Elusimicrobia bacterium]|nr:glycosyltransferase family 9 protein [Elusimicrobiota bacterium]MDE2236290.1 glycosyltransferase family 9 protein [Elusimicrobiota bacterium]MDE2424723.1 glycosyltransferase family 9 protein [Elusimicrobiota bacterium]